MFPVEAIWNHVGVKVVGTHDVELCQAKGGGEREDKGTDDIQDGVFRGKVFEEVHHQKADLQKL